MSRPIGCRYLQLFDNYHIREGLGHIENDKNNRRNIPSDTESENFREYDIKIILFDIIKI